MADTLPQVPTANSNAPASDASKPASKAGFLPKLKRPDSEKRRQEKLEAAKKKQEEIEKRLQEPKDFFKLATHSYIEWSTTEAPVNSYYKRFLGTKMSNLMTKPDFHPAQSKSIELHDYHDRLTRPQVSTAGGEDSKFLESVTSPKGKIQTERKPSNPLASPEAPTQVMSIVERRMQDVSNVQGSIDKEFLDATSIMKTGRTTLYSTIINNNENLSTILRTSLQRGQQGLTTLPTTYRQEPSTRSNRPQNSIFVSDNLQVSLKKQTGDVWNDKGMVSSSNHLLEASQQSLEKEDREISALYIPESSRQMKFDNRTKAQRKLHPLPPEEIAKLQQKRRTIADMQLMQRSQEKSLPSQSSAPKKPLQLTSLEQRPPDMTLTTGRQGRRPQQTPDHIPTEQKTPEQHSTLKGKSMEHKALVQGQLKSLGLSTHSSAEKRKERRDSNSSGFTFEYCDQRFRPEKIKVKRNLQRRQSFSLTQTKYGDARKLWHPLKEKVKMGTGPILNDLSTIDQMTKAKRYPIPEKLLGVKPDFELYIDSIMQQAYNSDENDQWASYKQEVDAPCNSIESQEKIEFYSSFSEQSFEEEVTSPPQDLKSPTSPKSPKSATESKSPGLKSQEQKTTTETGNSPLPQKKRFTKLKSKETLADRHDIVRFAKKKETLHLDKKDGVLKTAMGFVPDSREEREYEERIRTLKIHKDAINMHGFDLELLKTYPYKQQPGDVPTFLLKNFEQRFLQYPELQERIMQEFKCKSLFPTEDHIQLVYEQFCLTFEVSPLSIKQYLHDGCMQYENYVISLPQMKALACIIPLIPNLKKIYFDNNSLTDEMCTLLFMSAFQNPCLQSITLRSNSLKQSAATTFRQLLQACPEKLTYLDLSSSIGIGNHLDTITFDMGLEQETLQHRIRPGKLLTELNLSNIKLSQTAARNIGNILINSETLQSLDLSSCHIDKTGTRAIIDGLNRNVGLHYFNFSFNDMSSPVYEFAIKVAKIISRHEEIMHLNISNTGLTKEEVIFIGMALPVSKSCIGLHLSANGLTYYDRVFLRTLINAQVNFHFKNFAADRVNGVRKSHEQNMVAEHEVADFYDEDLKNFLRTFNFIEQQRFSLDEEIQTCLKDFDIVKIFQDLKNRTSPTNEDEMRKHQSQTLLNDLIDKVKQRQMHFQNQRQHVERFHDAQIDLSDPKILKNFETMGLYNQNEAKIGERIKQPDDKKELNLVDPSTIVEDKWLLQNALKIEKIRQRVESETEKEINNKYKTAGELALLFMGINKVAYDLLLKNPMTAYMNEVIFTRILGQPSIEGSETWKDTDQCWICEKWNKHRIEIPENYKGFMKQNIKKLQHLDKVLEACQKEATSGSFSTVAQSQATEIHKELKKEQTLKEIPEMDDEHTPEESESSLVTKSNDKTSSIATEDDEDLIRIFRETDPISPIKIGIANIQKMLPKNYLQVQNINSNQSAELKEGSIDLSSEGGDSDDDLLVMQGTKATTFNLGGTNNALFGTYNEPPRKEFAVLNDSGRTSLLKRSGGYKVNDASKISITHSIDISEGDQDRRGSFLGAKQVLGQNLKRRDKDDAKERERRRKVENRMFRRADGSRYRIKKKQVYYQGTSFHIDQEVDVDSNEESSVHTSDDEFEVDDDAVLNRLNTRLAQKKLVSKPTEGDVQKLLTKNIPKSKSPFGRKQMFLCCSFNDWIPIELKTPFEVDKEREHGSKLQVYLDSNRDANGEVKSSESDKNTVTYINYFPPGRHFFYLIYDRKYMTLSPHFDIVRYKDTSVYLNRIVVKRRTAPIKQVAVDRDLTNAQNEMDGDAKEFRKERSVFRTYQDDTEDYIQRMLHADITHSKIESLMRDDRDFQLISEILMKHYQKLKSVFLHYVANSDNYPALGQNDFTQLCYRSKILDRNFSTVTLDRLFIATNVSTNQYKNPNSRELHRYEFLEMIVRIAQAKYRDLKVTLNLPDAVEMVCSKDILPNNQQLNGMKFRTDVLYHPKVHELFSKNDKVIKKLFEQNVMPATKYMSLADIHRVVKKANLNITEQKINACFVESLISRVDTIKNIQAANQMRYVEFLVFVGRLSHEMYRNTKEERQLALHQKIDNILEPLLEVINCSKTFTFKERVETVEDEISEVTLNSKIARLRPNN